MLDWQREREKEKENLISITCTSVYLTSSILYSIFIFIFMFYCMLVRARKRKYTHSIRKRTDAYSFNVIFLSLDFFLNKIKISLLQSLSDVFLSTCFAFKLWKNCICFSFFRFFLLMFQTPSCSLFLSQKKYSLRSLFEHHHILCASPTVPGPFLFFRSRLAYAYQHTSIQIVCTMLWCNQIFKYACRLLCVTSKKMSAFIQ